MLYHLSMLPLSSGQSLLCCLCRPNVDSKNMRFKMVTEHKNIIGDSRAFDGSILYLPIKITDKVSNLVCVFCAHAHKQMHFDLHQCLCPCRESHVPVLGRQMVPPLIFTSHLLKC